MAVKKPLDEKERELITELERNCRLPLSKIAKKIGISFELARYKVNKLIQKGIIVKYLAVINFSELGFNSYGLLLNLRYAKEEERQAVVNFLCQHSSSLSVIELIGRFELQVEFLAKNSLCFRQILTNFLEQYGKYVSRKEEIVFAQQHYYEKKYLSTKKIMVELFDYKISDLGGELLNKEITPLERKILREIATEANISSSELSRRINIPASTLRFRIDKLVSRKIVRCFSAQINPQKYGYKVYLLLIKTRAGTKESEDRLRRFCQFQKNITGFYEVIGKWDYEVKVEVARIIDIVSLISTLKMRFSESIYEIEPLVVSSVARFDFFPAILRNEKPPKTI